MTTMAAVLCLLEVLHVFVMANLISTEIRCNSAAPAILLELLWYIVHQYMYINLFQCVFS